MRVWTLYICFAFVLSVWLLVFWQLGAFERRGPGRGERSEPREESFDDFGSSFGPHPPRIDSDSPRSGQRPEPDPPEGAWSPGRLVAREVLTDGEVILDAAPARLRTRFSIGRADAGRNAVEFVTRVPRSIPGRLAIVSARFDPEPSGIYAAGDGLYAVYHWSGGVRDAVIRQDFVLEVADRSGLRAGPNEDAPEGAVEPRDWLEPEDNIESRDPRLNELGRALDRGDRRRTLAAISEEVTRRLRPAPRRGARGALRLLDGEAEASRIGYCDLFVALARAAGIPARAVEGFATEVGDHHHHWVEVLLPRVGWRIIDPWAVEAGEADLHRLRGLRVPLAFRTRDPRLGGYHICYLHGAEDTQLTSWKDFSYRYVLKASD